LAAALFLAGGHRLAAANHAGSAKNEPTESLDPIKISEITARAVYCEIEDDRSP